MRRPSIGTITISTTLCACCNRAEIVWTTANLYSYEAGAIYENQRDYPHAIEEYVRGCVAGSAEFACRTPVARAGASCQISGHGRPGTAKTEQGSIRRDATDASRYYLRVKVLEAQNRKPEMESFSTRSRPCTTYDRTSARHRKSGPDRNRWKPCVSMHWKNRPRSPQTP